MRNLSVLIFGAAIALGLVTVMFARSYINGERLKRTEVVTMENDGVEMGTLVVTDVALNFGDELSVEALREVPWPVDPELRPEHSFSQIADVMDGERRVAIRSMARSEPVVQTKISGFGYRATLSQVVAPSMRATAIRVNDVTGVGGFVLPGDRVDVVFTKRDRQNDAHSESRLIVRDVRVLAIDQIADESTGGAVVAKAATLEVTQEQAQKLSLAARVGELDLSLRPMTANGEVLDEDMQTIRVADLVNDNGPTSAPAPVVYSARRVAAPVAPAPDPFATMTVTRGLDTQSTEVPRQDALDRGAARDADTGAETLAGGLAASTRPAATSRTASASALSAGSVSSEFPNP